MRFIRLILLLMCLAGGLCSSGLTPAKAAQPRPTAAEAAATAQDKEEGEGVPQKASEIGGRLGSKFPITNSMIVSWVVALALIIFARVAMKEVKEIPSGAQNFWEWMV